MRVRAKVTNGSNTRVAGIYDKPAGSGNSMRIYEGEEFELSTARHFSERWMEWVDGPPTEEDLKEPEVDPLEEKIKAAEKATKKASKKKPGRKKAATKPEPTGDQEVI